MGSHGVIYVAYGEEARAQARLSIKSLFQTNPRLPYWVVADKPFERMRGFPPIRIIGYPDADIGARQAKLSVDMLSPFDNTLYLDADTRVMVDLSPLFEILEDGWEMFIVPNRNQRDRSNIHIDDEERAYTSEQVGTDICALQGGVVGFRKCEAVHRFFSAWREEWGRWGKWDQAALLRTLVENPIKLFLIGQQWNGGPFIRHFYTMARRGELAAW